MLIFTLSETAKFPVPNKTLNESPKSCRLMLLEIKKPAFVFPNGSCGTVPAYSKSKNYWFGYITDCQIAVHFVLVGSCSRF